MQTRLLFNIVKNNNSTREKQIAVLSRMLDENIKSLIDENTTESVDQSYIIPPGLNQKESIITAKSSKVLYRKTPISSTKSVSYF